MKQLTKILSRSMATMPKSSFIPKKYTGPSFNELFSKRKAHVAPAVTHYFKTPLMLVQGHMQYVFDEKGARYLDLHGGILTVSIGHCHPKVNEAVIKTIETLHHVSNLYLTEQICQYTHELSKYLPKGLDSIYLVSSGAEANDMAVLLSRLFTGNNNYISPQNAFHGLTGSAYHLTAVQVWKHENIPTNPGHERCMFPDQYRGLFQGKDAGELYAKEVKNIIQYNTGGKVAGFICEPIQGVGGLVPMPDGYLKNAYKHVRAAGGLCTSDEVQCSIGRLGSSFWGCTDQGVIPDILTFAKGVGNGFNLAGVATTKEVSSYLAKKAHFNTFGGSPVACAAGRAVLKVIEEENLMEYARVQGEYINQRLMKMKGKYDIVGDVRGKGFMQGIEFVKSKQTKEADGPACANIVEKSKDMGLLLLKGGNAGNVVRFTPLFCTSKDDLVFALDVLEEAIDLQSKGKINYN